MLPCQKCGHDNELGRIFCHACGTKLDLSQMKPPKIRKHRAASPWRYVRRALDVVVVLALLVGGYLLLQPAELPAFTPDLTTTTSLDRKRMALDDAQMSGRVKTVELTEAELNAFFASLPLDKTTGKTIELLPQRIHATIEADVVTVTLCEQLRWGTTVSKDLTFTYRGKPVAQGGRFRLEPLGGAIGRLPLHQQIVAYTGVLDWLFGAVFQNLKAERQLLDRLESITAEPGKLILKYNPAALTR